MIRINLNPQCLQLDQWVLRLRVVRLRRRLILQMSGDYMPYRSLAQSRYLHAVHPDIAKRWDKEYPNQSNLPDKLSDSKSKPKRYKGTKEKWLT